VIDKVCGMTAATRAGDYDQPIDNSTGLQTEVSISSSNEPSDPLENQSGLGELFLPGEQFFREGGYVVDEEVMTMHVDNHRYIIGNTNLNPVDSDGVVAAADLEDVQEAIFQSDTPEVVVIVVGRSVRLGQSPEALPIPKFLLGTAEGSTEEITPTVLKKKLSTPTVWPVQNATIAAYGIMWTYVLGIPLRGTDLQLDEDNISIDLRSIPERKTRANSIYSQEVMSRILFGQQCLTVQE
jgi:hypothetical protein